jgi:hypothetical protein
VNKTQQVTKTGKRTVQASLGDVSHRMLDSPHNAINEELKLLWEKAEQC